MAKSGWAAGHVWQSYLLYDRGMMVMSGEMKK